MLLKEPTWDLRLKMLMPKLNLDKKTQDVGVKIELAKKKLMLLHKLT
jgi:hypothetical protein